MKLVNGAMVGLLFMISTAAWSAMRTVTLAVTGMT